MKGFSRRLALVLLLCGTTGFAADQPSSRVRSLEESVRAGMNLPGDTPFDYLGKDGKPIDAETLAAEAGKPGNAIAVSKPANGKVTLRLKDAQSRTPGAQLTHLPPLDLKDLSGQRVRNSDLTGRTTLLNFYFAECGPCVKEVPALNAFRQAHPELNYLAITFDPEAVASKFVAERKFEWPIIANAARFLESAGVRGFPAYMLIAPDGRIIGRQAGLGFRNEEETPGLASLEKFVMPGLAPR